VVDNFLGTVLEIFVIGVRIYESIHRVAILGAGTMGARIAAHFATQECFLLLDIVLQTRLRP